MGYSNTVKNLLTDALHRGQSFTLPTSLKYAQIKGNGKWAASTAYSVGDYVVPTTTNGRAYKCTTAGNSSASEPTWTTADGGTTSDGTAVWTEQTLALNAGTFVEPSGGGYSRKVKAASLAEWSGTQGAGSTAASSGTSGTSSNNTKIQWDAPTVNHGMIIGCYCFDHLDRNWFWFVFPEPKQAGVGVDVFVDIGQMSVVHS